jgi:hypothetical protein
MAVFGSKHERPAGVGIRTWRDIAKAGMLAVGLHWDAEYKMRHFASDARNRYGYAPRTKAYRRRKERNGVPGFLDMVLTGNTRRDVARLQVPRPFPTRVSIQMATQPYIQMRPDPRKRKAPNLGEELTRTIPEEIVQLERVFVASTEPLVKDHLEAQTGGK